MQQINASNEDLYAYIKDHSYHRMSDIEHAVVLLQNRFFKC
jgi:hypothetical protein